MYCKCGLHMLAVDHNESAPIAPRPVEPDDTAKMLLGRIESLLSDLGTFAQCKGCLQPMYWATQQPTRKRVAYNRDGTNHFGTCANQGEFARKGEKG